MKKRIISILLAVVMLASSMDVTAFAETASAAETEAIGGASYTETEMQKESGAASDTEDLTEKNGQEAIEEEPEDAPEEKPAEMQTPGTETQTEETEEPSDAVEKEEAAGEDAAESTGNNSVDADTEADEEIEDVTGNEILLETEEAETFNASADAEEVIASGDCGENLTWTLTGDGTLTISGTGEMEDYSSDSGKWASWYKYCSSMEKLVLGDGLTSIGDFAFYGCDFSGSLTLPSSVTSIGNFAFYNCRGLTGNLTLPDGVTSIGSGAFYNCSGFTGSLTLPSSMESIGYKAFYKCSGFSEDLTILGDVECIGYEAFYGCSGFSGSLLIIGNVGEIGYEAFENCSGFSGTLSMLGGVTHIGNEAFYGCSGFIGDLTIPENVTSIGSGAFMNCSGFSGSLTIPKNVESIGEWAFYGCAGFDGDLTIIGNAANIERRAFYGCNGFSGDLIIQGDVASIGDEAFYGCSGFNGNLIISGNVESIGEWAFYGCAGFSGSLTIPESTVSIGDEAFSGCSGFSGSLTIPENVTSIGEHAFYGCSGFNGDLTIIGSAANIGDAAFSGCSGFTGSLTISSNVVSIGKGAFYNCRGFTGSLTLPSSVTSIGEFAFSGCSGFSGDLTIPSSVTSIENYVFYDCSGLSGSLTIPSSVTSIGNYVFYNCSGLSGSLTIPNGVTSIGDYAFYNCSGLSGSLTIPGSVTSIGSAAFSYCSGFSGSLSFLGNIEKIGDRAFWNCSGFTGSLEFPNSVTDIGSYAFSGCSGFTGSLKIPNSVTNIGKYAFENCNGFTGTLTILGNVTEIKDGTFWNCNGFTGSLEIPSSVVSIGTNAFGNSGFTGSLIIPNGVTIIGSDAFSACGFTGDLQIPDSVVSIGSYAFDNCKGFNGNLTIPNGVTSIGDHAFYNCSGLTGNLAIPNGVTSIGNYVFYNCSGLSGSLTIPNGVTSIGNSAFYNCSGLSGSLTIPNGVTSIGNATFYNCSGLTGSLTIPSGVTSIGSSAFCNCSGLTGSLTIPGKVTSIGYNAFANCSGFTGSLTIPDSVTSLGSSAFSGCSGFTGNLTIGNGITKISSYAFSDCGGFRGKLTIGSGVESIGDYAFKNCSGLTGTVDIPDSVTEIGSGAFSGCALLTGMMLPEKIESLSSYLFDGCSSLEELVIPEGVESLGSCMIRGTAICSITIPSTVTESKKTSSSYYDRALAGAASLNEVIFAQGTTAIPAYICANASSSASFLTNVVIPDSVTSIGDYAFYNCKNLQNVYYGGTENQWSEITIGSNNTSLESAVVNGNIHYGITQSEVDGLTRIYIGSDNFSTCLGDEDCLAKTFTINWDADDAGKTVSWESSARDVFELTGETSDTYDGGMTWWPVYGNALSVGTSIVTVTTSDGAAASFEVTVTEKSNEVRVYGDGDLLVGEQTDLSAGIVFNTFYTGDEIVWKSSNPDVIAFDEDGTDSAAHSIVGDISDDSYTDEITVYARSTGKATVTCTLSVSGASHSFLMIVYTEDSSELQTRASNWVTAYRDYLNAVQECLETQKENVSETYLEQQVEALMEADDGLITFLDSDETIKKYVYQAVVEFMGDCADGELDMGSLSASTDVTSLSAKIVQKIYNAIDTGGYEYSYDDVTIRIEGITIAGAHQRTITYSKNGKDKKAAYLVSSKSQMERIIADYLEELLNLAEKEINLAYKEMTKSVFGKSLEDMVKGKIEKALSPYTKTFEATGVGKVTTAVCTSIDYYKHVKNLLNNATNDPAAFYNDLISMKALEFESESITDKTVNTAMKKLKKAAEALNDGLEEYVETGKISKESFLSGILSIFKCPVSISVFDSGGNRVGYVGDDDLWYDGETVSIERYGDAKYIYSYGEKVTFRIVGTGYGMLSCTFEEYSDGAAGSRVNYYDIPLYADKEISVELPGGDLSSEAVSVTADGSETIQADEEIEASDYEGASVEISCASNNPEGGRIFGTGVYVRGDAVTLQAIAAKGYAFVGWRDSAGALVSVSPVYEFTAREDLLLTALFVEDSSSSDDIVITDYTVSFDSDGGTETDSQIIQEYEKAVRPSDPVKENYSFAGWYLDGALFDFDTEITSDITLTAVWTEMERLAAPVPNIVSGSGVEAGTEVSLSAGTEGASIYYTLDGTDPTRGSILYTEPIAVTEAVTIKAFAVKEGYLDSEIVEFTYTVSEEGETGDDPELQTAEIPHASIPSGTEVEAGTKVSLSTDMAGTTIYYTLDGSVPTRESILYEDAVVIREATTIRAFAVREGYLDSGAAEFSYTVRNESQDWGGLTEEEQELYESPEDIPENLWVAGIPESADYTGSAITFDLRVYDHKTLLALKKDYTVSYKNNKNAADASAKKPPTVTVTGKGNYSGSIVTYFTINPVDIGTDSAHAGEFSAADILLAYSKNKTQKGTTVVYRNGKALKKGTDYTFDYRDGGSDGKTAYRDPGIYQVTIAGKGNYTGERTFREEITERTLIGKVSVSGISNQKYTGEELVPQPVLKYKKETLTGMEASEYKSAAEEEQETVDFTYSYADNKEIGTASVILTGVNDYIGTRTKTFKITGTALKNCTLKGYQSSFAYTGEEIRQDGVSFTMTTGSGSAKKTEELKGVSAEEFETMDAAARKDVGYTYAYSNDINAGKASVVYTGVNAYTGTVKKTYKINSYNLNTDSGGRIQAAFEDSVVYAKGGAVPALTVTYTYNGKSRTLTAGTDYTVSCQNNTAVKSAAEKKPPTVFIQGKGCFSGKRRIGYFSITARDIGSLTASATDIVWKNKANIYKSSIVITDLNGKKLTAGTDYERTLRYEYAEKANVVNNKAEVVRQPGDAVDAKDILPVGTLIRVTATGKKNYAGTVSAAFLIVKGSLSGASVSVKSQYYTGKAVEPDKDEITVKIGKTALEKTDYVIAGYTNNIAKGTAKVTLRGTGDYGGTKTVSFKILDRSMYYIVKFNGNGATGGSMGNLLIPSGKAGKALTANKFSRKGYTFAGWNTAADGSGTAYANKEKIVSSSSVYGAWLTLYAQWKPVS